MMRHVILPLAAVCAAPAVADPRVTTHFFQPSQIVTLRGHAGIETTIAFAPDERIENIAVGNSAAWQVTPNKRANLLFVKPAGARAHTNMTVITDQRTYLFDLVSTPSSGAVYMMRFTYPEAPKPVVPVIVAAAIDASASMPAAPVAAAAPAELNFAWDVKGDRHLLPTRIFDDGRSTFIEWSRDVSLPAILVREASGQEGPVNSTVQGPYIVVQGVPAQLVLRQGRQTATLTPTRHGPSSPAAPAAIPAPLGQVASVRP